MLMILAVFSIFFGFITKDMFIGLGSGFFSDNALFIHPSHEIMLDTEFAVPTLFKLLPLMFTISLSVIAIVLSEYFSTILIYFKLSRLGYNIFSFFNQRFLIELFYNRYITGIILKLGGQTTKVIDKGSVEYLGPYGLEKGLWNISSYIARLNTGVITSYALYILIGLIAYLLFNSYMNSSIIILALCVSLSLVSFRSSVYTNTVYRSSSVLGGVHYAVSTLIYYLGISVISCDSPKAWGIYFQDIASLEAEKPIFDNNIMYYIVIMSVLLLGFLVFLSTKNSPSSKKSLELETPSDTPPRCNHNIVDRRHLGPADYGVFMYVRCSGHKPVIRYPADRHRGTLCMACNSKVFCSDNRCICRNTD